MSRWCALKLRVDCPECGSAVLVDGPYKKAPCAACGARVPLGNVWKWLIDAAEREGAGGRHFRLSTMLRTGRGELGAYHLGLNRGHPPICAECDEVLDEVEQGIADGHAGTFHCPSCGAGHPTWPAPGYLKQAGVTQVFMAPPEPEKDDAPEVASAAKPVVFQCPNCGANLTITSESKRICTCSYCDVDSYLPAALWNQLHPIRRRRAFWLRRP